MKKLITIILILGVVPIATYVIMLDWIDRVKRQGGISATLPIPYAIAESNLIDRLNIDKLEMIEGKWPLATADAELKESMKMGLFHSEIQQYSDGNHLRFEAHHEYNIGGTGKESITFDLMRISSTQTQVKIDYYEHTWLFAFIPMPPDSGEDEEAHILATIFGTSMK